MSTVLTPPESVVVPSQTRYTATCIRSPLMFGAMAGEWNDLFRRAGCQNICLTHEWLSSWLAHFPGNLRIILVRDEAGMLAGAAPLAIHRGNSRGIRRLLRYVQTIGSELSIYDQTEWLVADGHDMAAVFREIAGCLISQQTEWDGIDLQNFSKSVQVETLAAVFSECGLQVTVEPAEMIMPYIALPDSVEAFEATGRKKKLKAEIRRVQNKCQREHQALPAVEYRSPGPETDQLLERFYEQHTQYWGARGRPSKFRTHPQLRRFFRDMLRKSQPYTGTDWPHMTFTVLKLKDEPMSYHLGFFQGNTRWIYIAAYNPAFHPYSPGLLHMEAMIKESILQGRERFEFGRGEEHYKMLWANATHPLWNVRAFRTSLMARIDGIDPWLRQLLKRDASPKPAQE